MVRLFESHNPQAIFSYCEMMERPSHPPAEGNGRGRIDPVEIDRQKRCQKNKRKRVRGPVRVNMLAAKKLPEILQAGLTDGVSGLCLLTVDGAILSSALSSSVSSTSGETPSNDPSSPIVTDIIALAAIASSTWSQFTQSGRYLLLVLTLLLYLIIKFFKKGPATSACTLPSWTTDTSESLVLVRTTSSLE